jgi:RNA polymerase sigma factor (sigma-70 family)
LIEPEKIQYGSRGPTSGVVLLMKSGRETENVTVFVRNSAAIGQLHSDGVRGIIRDYGSRKEWAVRLPSANRGVGLRNLAERIRHGDTSAETDLVGEFAQQVFVMAVVRTHDREAARELVQDVLMAVIVAVRKGQLQDADKLAPFVHGTARNLINNRLRNESQQPQMEPLPDHLEQGGCALQLEDEERIRMVHQAMERLGPEDRRILCMTLVEGLKPGEIAAAIGLTSEVVRTRKLRAVKKVADLIRKKMSRTQANLPHRYKQ